MRKQRKNIQLIGVMETEFDGIGWAIEQEKKPRAVSTIAQEITTDWHSRIYFGAKPYLQAMHWLTSIDDHYGLDSGRSVVAYFLSNAQTWRGEVARRVKKELNGMLKDQRS